jgi:hypothetical protein
MLATFPAHSASHQPLHQHTVNGCICSCTKCCQLCSLDLSAEENGEAGERAEQEEEPLGVDHVRAARVFVLVVAIAVGRGRLQRDKQQSSKGEKTRLPRIVPLSKSKCTAIFYFVVQKTEFRSVKFQLKKELD